jgi:hypothetical protein
MEFDSFRMIDLLNNRNNNNELGFPFIIDESSKLIKTEDCTKNDCAAKSKVI